MKTLFFWIDASTCRRKSRAHLGEHAVRAEKIYQRVVKSVGAVDVDVVGFDSLLAHVGEGSH